MKIFEVNCFTSEMLSQTPKVLKSGAVQIGPNYLCVDGKAVSAFWNSDGALVISDDKGVTHYFVGLQKDFPAYGDEKAPHDIDGYKKAINENKKLRSGEKDEEDARKDRKERKSGKSSCGTCCVLKWVFKIFFGWLCLCINLNDD